MQEKTANHFEKAVEAVQPVRGLPVAGECEAGTGWPTEVAGLGSRLSLHPARVASLLVFLIPGTGKIRAPAG